MKNKASIKQKIDLPLRWYHVYKNLLLIVAILTVFGFIIPGSILLHIFRKQEDTAIESIFGHFYFQCSAAMALITLLFLLTYFALRTYHKTVPYLIYAQNILIPAAILIFIPFLNAYYDRLFDYMIFVTNEPELSAVRNVLQTASPIILVLEAVFVTALLTLNSIYFRKRKALFQAKEEK